MNTGQLTFTRFIAASFIVFYHFASNLFPSNSEFVQVIRENFSLGVSYFYALSGFVMVLAYGNQNRVEPKRYFINRLARLYPLHLFTLGLTIIVSIFVAINYLGDYKIDPISLILNLTLIQAWFPAYSLTFNVPSWSISVELFFYLVFPFIFNQVYKKLKLSTFAVIVVLFWIICQVAMNLFYTSTSYGGENSLDRYFLHYNPFFHLNTFLVGLLFAGIFKRYEYKLSKNFDFLIILMIPTIAIMIYLFRDYLLHNGLLAFNFGALILLIAANKGRITTLFNHRILIHLGNISFAMYLLQNPIFIFSRKISSVLNVQNEYLLFIITFPILLIASHITYRLIEIPWQKKIRGMYA
ncbi:acyltransferase [Chryseobacterium piperi]|uniref:acyltransferase family protein n=1 Tax=Chryseobacterium piperi TaxID=558152 RepID=UPI00068C4EBE|nr:acyltransferase [Chryseobacterium piperi]ASW75062.1 acyltransferase [Chryseobacterium piperi]